MPDNKTKRRKDAKRFAISQKHERDYMIKSAKKLLKKFEEDKKVDNICKIILFNKDDGVKVGTKPIMRCFKVLINILENYKKKK